MRGLLVVELTDDCDRAFHKSLHYRLSQNIWLYGSWRDLQRNDTTPNDKYSSPDTIEPDNGEMDDAQPTPMTKEGLASFANHFYCCFRSFIDSAGKTGKMECSAKDSFDTNSNFPFPSPTAPAPGPSLLDDNESKFLDSFFDGANLDQFNYDFFNNPPDGSQLGHVWDEILPAFMGTTSSFGQQPQIGTHGLSDPHFGNMNSHMNARPSIPPSTSADVLAAASVLQNGSAARSHSMSDALFRGHDLHATNGQSRTQSMSIHPPRTQLAFAQRPKDNFFTDMIFGGQPKASMRHAGSSRKVDIHWGSDVGFGNPQGFIAPPNRDNHLATGSAYKQVIENSLTLNVPSSANTTQPLSPIITKSEPRPRAVTNTNEINGDNQDLRPKKRRKSKFQDEVDKEDESTISIMGKTAAKKRKSGKRTSIKSPAPESESLKRRKSTTAAAAKARENLTEDQKRENHIKSEQKRRMLIREGFEDLGELVPGLRGGRFSKSAVLIMAADWLEDLIKGNEELQRRLDQMEGR
ncbi:hypothetical protein IFR05_016199 [Cadophora sp. M221]|nr:hypothetical protein IFR05_016199 [Cadophora sp. M221]